jgi:hypothetical protein
MGGLITRNMSSTLVANYCRVNGSIPIIIPGDT